MDSDAEITECPLCMEQLDVDDIQFYPCPCLYQICRFCWHRLYNLEDNIENVNKGERGRCPACRQVYPEIPVFFNSSLTIENIEQMKKQKKKRNKTNTQKQKQLEDKQKLKEILKTQEKNLSGLRVVQKNLVFVIGLPTRLTQEDLRREFVKFGKIHKLVVGNCSANVNTAYVTYLRAEDAIKAILALNNQSNQINRLKDSKNGKNTVLTLKASLGTTKYCSHWLRSQTCPKIPDCMYLHELADSEASFTKEEMSKGKHTDYEKKLINQYCLKLEANNERIVNEDEMNSESSHHEQQLQQEQNDNYSTASCWGSVTIESQEVNEHSKNSEDKVKKLNMNTFDEIISSSSDSLSTSYSTCSSGSSGVSVPSPRNVEDVECLMKQTDDFNLSKTKTDEDQNNNQNANNTTSNNSNNTSNENDNYEDDDDGLDFDPISVSTNGLQDLIKSSTDECFTQNSSILHSNIKTMHFNNADAQQEWRSSFKAIFPNVNITFANSNNFCSANELNHETQKIETPFVKQMNNQRQNPNFAQFLPFMMQHQLQQQQQHQQQQMNPDYSWLQGNHLQQHHHQQQQQQQQQLQQQQTHRQHYQRHNMQQFIGNQNNVQRLYSSSSNNHQLNPTHEPATHLNPGMTHRRYISKSVYTCQPPPGFSNF